MAEAKPFLLPGFVQILAQATVDLKATLCSDSLDTHTVQETEPFYPRRTGHGVNGQ